MSAIFSNEKVANNHVLITNPLHTKENLFNIKGMKRKLYAKLLAWKTSKNRKPLVLRGARQVGKTHLLKTFGKQEYDNCIYLNFEEDPKLSEFFSGKLKPSIILENLSAYLEKDIHAENTLIIFDEIQECPEALNSLKYFQENANEFHIVSAGSLLGVKLANTKGFPVGKVNFLDLYPLSFFEFLEAIGKNKLQEFLMNISEFNPIPEPLHEDLIMLLKKYMYIGGMPEAVMEYVETESLMGIKAIQKEILDAYVLDFAKHAPKDQIMKITEVWESIPSQLAKENKKFIFSAIRQGARGREYETAVQWLADAGLIYKSYNISVPKLPLLGYSNKNIFKIFLLDVGLLATMSNVSVKSVVEERGLFSEFYGAFTENFVAQELSQQHQSLYYWTSAGIAEVDFVIEQELDVYPLEVKAGVSTKKKSLVVFNEKYKPKTSLRTSLMNLKKDGNITNIPLYFLGRLTKILVN